MNDLKARKNVLDVSDLLDATARATRYLLRYARVNLLKADVKAAVGGDARLHEFEDGF